MWSRAKLVLQVIGGMVVWTLGMLLGLTLFVAGIKGPSRCEGVEPGGSCAYTSVRGTTRVAYEDLEKVDWFSLLLGSAILLALGGLMLIVLVLLVGEVRARVDARR